MTLNTLMRQVNATFARITHLVSSASVGALRWRAACMSKVPVQPITKHRRSIAIAVSVTVHGLLVLALLPHSSSGFSAGGQGGAYQGEGEGLNLDLTAMALPETHVLEVRERKPEEVAELDSVDDLTTVTHTESLSDALPDTPSLAQADTAQGVEATPPQTATARQGGEGQGGTSSGTFDDLWEAIAPCWRRIADKDTLAVNLTVTFAGNGMLAKPPEIIRAIEDSSNASALRSESLAITALAECGAYQMAAGRENVSIHFPKP